MSELNTGTNIVSVVFTDVDVKKTMPHLKGISNAIALESIQRTIRVVPQRSRTRNHVATTQ
jgi:hypothetical protein